MPSRRFTEKISIGTRRASEWEREQPRNCSFLVFSVEASAKAYAKSTNVIYTSNPQSSHVYVVVNIRRKKKQKCFHHRGFSCSCARPERVGRGKQEENVECRKSLSKNTRFEKKNFGELRRATVWLVPQAERKNAKIPLHSHTHESAFHENSMLSGEICGVACWVTFTLRAFLRFQLRLSFSPATQTHAIGETWKTPTEAFHRRKRVLKVNGFLSIPHFRKDITPEKSLLAWCTQRSSQFLHKMQNFLQRN